MCARAVNRKYGIVMHPYAQIAVVVIVVFGIVRASGTHCHSRTDDVNQILSPMCRLHVFRAHLSKLFDIRRLNILRLKCVQREKYTYEKDAFGGAVAGKRI